MSQNINLVFITDENYVMPTVVAITSVLRNRKKQNNLNINVIVSNISEKSRQILNSFCAKNVNFNIIEVKNNYTDIATKNYYVSDTALLKFDIPNILSEYDKVLYLDSDIIVRKDLAELFNIEISDCYAAVCKDMKASLKNEHLKYNLKEYFNSGVMLLNLKKMREDSITNNFVQTKSKINSHYQDQDVFNIVFDSKIKFISAKYNYLVTYCKYTKQQINNFYNEDIKNISVIHLTWLKPWEYDNIPYGKEWMKYYKMTAYKKDKLNLIKSHELRNKIRKTFLLLMER